MHDRSSLQVRAMMHARVVQLHRNPLSIQRESERRKGEREEERERYPLEGSASALRIGLVSVTNPFPRGRMSTLCTRTRAPVRLYACCSSVRSTKCTLASRRTAAAPAAAAAEAAATVVVTG